METMMTAVATEQYTFYSILDQLNQFHQRATYGAVAGVAEHFCRAARRGPGIATSNRHGS